MLRHALRGAFFLAVMGHACSCATYVVNQGVSALRRPILPVGTIRRIALLFCGDVGGGGAFHFDYAMKRISEKLFILVASTGLKSGVIHKTLPPATFVMLC